MIGTLMKIDTKQMCFRLYISLWLCVWEGCIIIFVVVVVSAATTADAAAVVFVVVVTVIITI